ncbi:MAG: response regulator [Paludibacter sp.]|nr:response regulator [Paludibacter sp.]
MNSLPEQKILLIEDNPGDSRLIQEMLNDITSFKYKLVVADTLKEGCQLILKNEFILILLDLNLPDSTGKSTFDVIIQYAVHTPVVLISGLQNVELSLSLIKEGAQDYIIKPDLNSSLLGRTIEFAIERKKLMTQLRAKTSELEQLNYYYVTRELIMNKLKNEVNELLERCGERKKYS